jgi:hypothetical protein
MEGCLGRFETSFRCQTPASTGIPHVEIRTSGPIKAERQSGRVVIESTGSGLAEIDLFVIHNQPLSAWELQMPDAPGVGSTRINVSVQFSPDVRGIEADNGILLRDGSQENHIVQGFGRAGWHADAEVPQGQPIWLNIAYEQIPRAPMWMVLSSLATAVLALALSGYVLWRSRRRPPLYSPPSIP